MIEKVRKYLRTVIFRFVSRKDKRKNRVWKKTQRNKTAGAGEIAWS